MTSLTSFFLKHGLLGLAVLAFAEASFFPAPPDLILVPLCVLKPSLGWLYALICTAASVLGGLFGHALGAWMGRRLLDRWVPQGVSRRVEALFRRYGGWAVGIAGFTPAPYKAFALGAGVFGMSRVTLVIASLIGRGTRFFGEALLVSALGESGLALIQQSFEEITIGATVVAVLVWLVGRKTHVWRSLGVAVNRAIAGMVQFYELRLKKLGTLGFWLITCMALASFFLLTFVWTANELVEQGLAGFDQAVSAVIQGVSFPWLSAITSGVSFLGTAGFLTALCFVVTWRLLLGGRRDRAAGLGLLGALVGSSLSSVLLKAVFQRSYPPGPPPVAAGSYSFPSGHSMVAFAVYLVLAYLLWRNQKPGGRQRVLALLLVFLALAVGISRIFLGVSYPSDVIAGLAAGGLWASGAIIGIIVAGERRGE